MKKYPQWFEIMQQLEKDGLIFCASMLTTTSWLAGSQETFFILKYEYEFTVVTGISVSMEKFDCKLHAKLIGILDLPFCMFFNEKQWISFAWSTHPENAFKKLKYTEYRGDCPIVTQLRTILYHQ